MKIHQFKYFKSPKVCDFPLNVSNQTGFFLVDINLDMMNKKHLLDNR